MGGRSSKLVAAATILCSAATIFCHVVVGGVGVDDYADMGAAFVEI